jgi:hypothetical protein
MSGQWSGEGLRRVSEGAMFFAPSESRVMRDRLGSGGDRRNCIGPSARTPGSLSSDPPISTVRGN